MHRVQNAEAVGHPESTYDRPDVDVYVGSAACTVQGSCLDGGGGGGRERERERGGGGVVV